MIICAVAGCPWRREVPPDDIGTPVVAYRDHLHTHSYEDLVTAMELSEAGRLMADDMIRGMR